MTSKPSIGYVVYLPPHKGLPYLAVTLMPDGTVIAKQFETESAADEYCRQLARGGDPSGARH